MPQGRWGSSSPPTRSIDSRGARPIQGAHLFLRVDVAFPISLDDIKAASRTIEGAVERTPTRPSRTLSEIAGCEIWLKFENLQFTASFKDRGAFNKLSSLTAEERSRGVIAMSAGNHAQGVAYHAGRLGIPATIVMPRNTPFSKVKHTKGFGARVELAGGNLSEASYRAREIAAAENLVFVHPYDDPKIIAGQATVAVEMLFDTPHLDAIVVPIGGGGLISGIAIAAKALKPEIDIYGVQTRVYPSMYNAVKHASLPCVGQTMAEGIAVKDPGVLTTPVVRALVKDILLVGETDIEHSIASLLEIEKTLVEGAAAAVYAAVIANREIFKGRKVGLVLSGGNVDMRLLSNVILRELSREGRILSLVIEIVDRPGVLAQIATLVGEGGGNILEVAHNRMATDTSAKLADLGMTVETRDAEHAADIKQRLEAAGFRLKK
ncbi:MAG: threonine ammonia-lyase [Alphaproteobacteria bacterium]|nr:threonine ammonia-lyase [Alphaproteobacteria bacterium]